MRIGLRAKEAIAIILLTFLVVAATTLIHLTQLTRVILQEASDQAELISKQVYAQARRSLVQHPGKYPWKTLKEDRHLRSLLDASVGYSPYILYVLIADNNEKVILHNERRKEGSGAPDRTSLRQLLSLGSIRRFQALYQEGRTYESTLPVSLNSKPFGSIRLGIATSLLRREVTAALKQSLILVGLTLPLAWLVAMILANRVLAELRGMSHVDQLTGLYNRRGFLLLAQQHLKIASRTKKGVLLLFADLDDMKRINDTLGHREGDRALIDTANILKETFREADVVARIGGDEFAVTPIEAREDSIKILTNRLQDKFDAWNAKADRPYKLSISLGVASYDPESPCSIDDLLAQADKSMYEQKQSKQQP